MSMMRLTGCCCPALVSGCNAWLAQCFGSSDPTTFPQSASVQGGGGMTVTQYCECPNMQYVAYEATESFSFSGSGSKVIQPYWANNQGIRYSLTGSFTYSLTHRTWDCLYELGEIPNEEGQYPSILVGSRINQTLSQVGGGSFTGWLSCGAVPIPNAQGQCGFNASFYRGWSLSIGGSGPSMVTQTFHGIPGESEDETQQYEQDGPFSAACVWGGGCVLNQPHDSLCNVDIFCGTPPPPPTKSGKIGRADYGGGIGTIIHAPGWTSIVEPAFCQCSPQQREFHTGHASMSL